MALRRLLVRGINQKALPGYFNALLHEASSAIDDGLRLRSAGDLDYAKERLETLRERVKGVDIEDKGVVLKRLDRSIRVVGRALRAVERNPDAPPPNGTARTWGGLFTVSDEQMWKMRESGKTNEEIAVISGLKVGTVAHRMRTIENRKRGAGT